MFEFTIAVLAISCALGAVYIVFRDPPWGTPDDYPEQDDDFGT